MSSNCKTPLKIRYEADPSSFEGTWSAGKIKGPSAVSEYSILNNKAQYLKQLGLTA